MPVGSLDVRDWKTNRRRVGAGGGPVRSRIESDDVRMGTLASVVVAAGGLYFAWRTARERQMRID